MEPDDLIPSLIGALLAIFMFVAGALLFLAILALLAGAAFSMLIAMFYLTMP